jgi:gamma-glutamyltranspeptidase/glutathione hydrolase
VAALGGVLGADDLRRYQARIVDPIVTEYRGAALALAPALTAGPSMRRALHGLRHERFRRNGPHADAFLAYARVLREAYSERLATMGEGVAETAATSTTHLNVIDRQGNMVALTQTLLSVFGSKLVLPSSGVLMNNGMMWFDPRQESPNCIAPGKRPLTNMCPVIATRDGKPWFAIGASGGRKIFPAVMQIVSFLRDHEMTLEDAFHQPRLDASGGDSVTVDPLLPGVVRKALAEEVLVETADSSSTRPTTPAERRAARRGRGENFGRGRRHVAVVGGCRGERVTPDW